MKKCILLPAIIFLTISATHAQNISINNTAAAPHASAMLDVNHPNKGLLIPRVALTGSSDALTIATPATSLLIFNTATIADITPGYYYWNGTLWLRLTTGTASGGLGWQLNGNAGTADGTDFIGTTDGRPFNIRVANEKAGRIDHVKSNVFFGYKAGNNNTTGFSNTAVGHGALQENTTANFNTALGSTALSVNTTGFSNTATGFQALKSNTTGNFNTATGSGALNASTTGTSNTANGSGALGSNTIGNNNTATGSGALTSNTTGISNTASGAAALLLNTTGASNTANGAFALRENTTGGGNTATGESALLNNTIGAGNTATGVIALGANVSGNNNTATGVGALNNNNTGNNNTATGSQALSSNTSGISNTAAGQNALFFNSAGDYNTASGVQALMFNSTGLRNSGYGAMALQSNTTGNYNTAYGAQALYTNTTGVNNTAIGYLADVSGGALTNATAIGSGAVVNASNKVRIGNADVTVIEGQVPYSFPSDKRFKYNIKDNVPGLDFIKKLQPVTYNFDSKKLAEYTRTGVLTDYTAQQVSYSASERLHTGFLAQDVQELASKLGYDFDGVHMPANNKDHYSLAYSQFIMPLVKGMQEQQQLIESQRNDIEMLKLQVAELTKAIKQGSK